MGRPLPALPSSALLLSDLKSRASLTNSGISVPSHLVAAVEKRQLQSMTARWCAQEAARVLGSVLGDLPVDEKGIPCWPPELVGSLSHTDLRASALVARGSDYISVGCDVEEMMSPVKAQEVRAAILTPHEISSLPKETELEASHITRIFSLKEAFYKAIFPLEKRFIDFQEVEVLGLGTAGLTIRPLTFLTPAKLSLTEYLEDKFVVSGVYLQR